MFSGIRPYFLLLILVCLSLGAQPEGLPAQGGATDVPMLLNTQDDLGLLHRGRQALKEMKIREAEVLFRQLGNNDGGDIAATYHLTTASLVKFLMTDEEDYYEEFSRRSGELKRLLKAAPRSQWRQHLDAEMNLQRAIVRGKRGKYFKAARAARSAFNGFEKVIRTDSTFYEAYKGMGLLQLTLGSAPSFYRKFFRLFGFSGSMEQGLEGLRLAAANSEYNREEAMAYITMIDVILYGSTLEGGVMAEKLASSFDSPLFAHLYGYYLHENRRGMEAEDAFRKAESSFHNPDYFPVHYSKYYLGSTLFRQNRFEEAAALFRDYLDVHSGLALRASTHLHLGLSLEMLGDRTAAMDSYRRVEVKREFDMDVASKRRAERYLLRPMSDVEKQLLRGHNLYDSGIYHEADSVMATVILEESETDVKAEAHYWLGRSKHAQGKLDEAVASYRTSVAHDPRNGTRWAPWSMYYEGVIHENAGRFNEARNAYIRARDYGGNYDYQSAIENNVKIALKRLKGR